MLTGALLTLATAALTSCNAIGHATKPETVCAAFKPIYISTSDVLSQGTADQILAHNLTGKTLCNWKPHSR